MVLLLSYGTNFHSLTLVPDHAVRDALATGLRVHVRVAPQANGALGVAGALQIKYMDIWGVMT